MELDEREDYQGQLDRYLLDRTTPDERRSIETRRQSDESFAENLSRDEAIVTELRAAEDRALKQRLQRLEATSPHRAVVVRRLPLRRWLAVAASVAVLLLAGWWALSGDFFTPSSATLLAESFEPYPNRAYNLTKGATPAETRAIAYAAYESGNYERAAAAFAELTDPAPADRFYQANALLARERPADALPLFRQLAEQADFALAAHSQWYAALSLIALDRREEAQPILQTITTETDHPFQAQAGALLARLE